MGCRGDWELPPPAAVSRPAVELAETLLEQARAEGVELVGPGGLLGDLTKKVLGMAGTPATAPAPRR